jgi:hypothetical protein
MRREEREEQEGEPAEGVCEVEVVSLEESHYSSPLLLEVTTRRVRGGKERKPRRHEQMRNRRLPLFALLSGRGAARGADGGTALMQHASSGDG